MNSTMSLKSLKSELRQLSKARPFRSAWYLCDIQSGLRCDSDGDMLVPAASTRKVLILAAAFCAVGKGLLDLEQSVVITADLQDNDSGCLRFFRPGFRLTLYDALLMMIVVSDNCATAAIVSLLGLDEINRYARSIGMPNTIHRQAAPANSRPDEPTPADLSQINTTQPREMGSCLERLLAGSTDEQAARGLFLDSDLCRTAIDILLAQQFRNKIPALLPSAAKIANKTGVGPSNESDVGIVFDGDAPIFILAAYTFAIPNTMPDGLPGRVAAQLHIAKMARLCWDRLRRG